MKIEHELPERSFETRQRAFIDNKTRAGHFSSGFKIHHT